MSQDQFQYATYTITTDPHYRDKEYAVTPELRKQIEKLFHHIVNNKKLKSNIARLSDLIEKHPENPQLKNMLSVAYSMLGDDEKAFEINHRILSEHPDYLFGKINLANEYYVNEEYEKMKDILGEKMEIQALYPDRDTFHIEEVTGFYKTAVLYFTATGNIQEAESRMEIMNEIAPEHPDTEEAEMVIAKARMEEGFSTWNKETIKSQHPGNTLPEQTDESPEFTNPLIHELYKNDLYIEQELVNDILSLPRESLISDLELVLDDCMRRYEYYTEYIDENDYEEEKLSFPLHAMMLLGELRAEESLPKILEVFRQDNDFLEFWFSDHLSETLWEPLYHLGNKQLDVFKTFIKETVADTYAKGTLLTAVSQIASHQPEREKEILDWYAELMDFYNQSSIENDLTDITLISFIIVEVTNLQFEELLPKIKLLYDKEYVDELIAGDFQSIKQSINEPPPIDRKLELLGITERYKRITSTWAGYNKDVEDKLSDEFWNNLLDQSMDNSDNDDLEYDDYDDVTENQPVHKEKKLGRNDPCPCGSGKKYKKCCMNKEK